MPESGVMHIDWAVWGSRCWDILQHATLCAGFPFSRTAVLELLFRLGSLQC